MKFSIQGASAFDQYKQLEIDAMKYGVRSNEAFWIASEYYSRWQQASTSRFGGLRIEVLLGKKPSKVVTIDGGY